MADELLAGTVAGDDYVALDGLVGKEQLGLIATAELLDWRADTERVRRAEEPDREEAQQLWTLIDQHRDALLPDPAVGGSALS